MNERCKRAEELLQEAVYASRAQQAAGVSLLSEHDRDGSSSARCGLGRTPAIELGLSERGRAALEALWPGGPSEPRWTEIRAAIARWVERCDQLDRDRNHFLKAFRNKHGFDRRDYTPEQLEAYEQGLETINARVTAERDAAARELLGPDA